MSDTTNVVQSGGNLTKLKADIRRGIGNIIDLEKKRAGVNADIAAVRKKLVAAGVNRHALAAVLAYQKMDDVQRDGFDEGYLISRESIGLPVQGAFDFPTRAQANGEDEEEGVKVGGLTWEDGRQAGCAGKAKTENGWPKSSKSHHVWNAGWLKGQKELAKEMKAPAKKSGRRKGAGKATAPA